MSLLQMLQRSAVDNVLLCVASKYGGSPSRNKRFQYSRQVIKEALSTLCPNAQIEPHRLSNPVDNPAEEAEWK